MQRTNFPLGINKCIFYSICKKNYHNSFVAKKSKKVRHGKKVAGFKILKSHMAKFFLKNHIYVQKVFQKSYMAKTITINNLWQNNIKKSYLAQKIYKNSFVEKKSKNSHIRQ